MTKIADMVIPSQEVTFSASKIRSKVSSNNHSIMVTLTLKRNDTGESKKVYALIGNYEGALESIELLPGKSVEETWKYPRIKYLDPHKKDGYSIDILHSGGPPQSWPK